MTFHSILSIGKLAVLTGSLLCSVSVFGWGQTGHRISGEIAEQFLTEEAKTAIKALIGPESLAEASTYADEMRSAPDEFWQKTANPYHYVTLKNDPHYHSSDCPPQGDAVSALNSFTATLRNPDSSREDKQLALRFIVHIIGDLHQPLHVSSAARQDKGGNMIKVSFFRDDSNLHRVWDSALIDHQQLSYSEFAGWLSNKITAEQAKEWSVTKPEVWIHESATLRASVYPERPELSWQYIYDHTPTVKLRLQQAGVRIAAYLNAIWK